MSTKPRHLYIPDIKGNKLKLVFRLIKHENPAARFALLLAFGGILLIPLDWCLAYFEKRIYAKSKYHDSPIILVCGPARGGTTIIAEYLINNLNAVYINNLMSLFPKAPITASKLFGRFISHPSENYNPYYGRSMHLGGANDGLYIWDQWLGGKRSERVSHLVGNAEKSMPEFFSALQSEFQLPVINKVNQVVTCADLVAKILPNCIIVCVSRNPLMLAQSLYVARKEINGSYRCAYGIKNDEEHADPISDVCKQVVNYENFISGIKKNVEKSKLISIPYESFCSNPHFLLNEIRNKCSGQIEIKNNLSKSKPFVISNDRKVSTKVLEAMKSGLAQIQQSQEH